jgi:hypothetical protein
LCCDVCGGGPADGGLLADITVVIIVEPFKSKVRYYEGPRRRDRRETAL